VQWSVRHEIDSLLRWRSGEEVASSTDAATLGLVRRLMLRHAALSGLAAGEDMNDRREEFFEPRMAELAMAEECAAAEAAGLAARERLVGDSGRVETAPLLEFLDGIAPAISWETEFGEIADWSLTAMTPHGEELAMQAGVILDEMAAMAAVSLDDFVAREEGPPLPAGLFADDTGTTGATGATVAADVPDAAATADEAAAAPADAAAQE
jgi:hypothetical protein